MGEAEAQIGNSLSEMPGRDLAAELRARDIGSRVMGAACA